MSRELELDCESWTFCFELFPNSSATDIVFVTLSSTAVETAIARCTSRCAMARGHRLNTAIVLAAVHGFAGLFRTVSAAEPSLFRPLPPPTPPPPPVPNKQPRFCGRKAKCTRTTRSFSPSSLSWASSNSSGFTLQFLMATLTASRKGENTYNQVTLLATLENPVQRNLPPRAHSGQRL